MNKEEIKIITLGDIFKNIETEEKAFNFLNYIKKLQQENQQLKKQKDDVVSEIKRVLDIWENKPNEIATLDLEELLRMLGEIDG